MMVVITGATAEIADPIPPATAPMIPAACWMVGTRVMITGPMPDMAVVTAGAIWLNPDEILLTKLDATGRAVDARLLMTGPTWLNADLAAPIPLLRFCPNDADSFWITGWALSIMEMVSDKTGFNCSTIPRPKSAALLFSFPVMVDTRPAPDPASFPAAPPKKLSRSPDTPEKPFFLNSSAETLKPNSFKRSVSPTFRSPRASMASISVLVPPLAAAISSASFTISIAEDVSPPANDTALDPAWITSPVSNGVALALLRSCSI